MKRIIVIAALLLAALVLPPAAIVWSAAVSRNQTIADYVSAALERLHREEKALPSLDEAVFETPDGPPLEGLQPSAVGASLSPRAPLITHLAVTDMDGDGAPDILASDVTASVVARLTPVDGGTSFSQSVVTDVLRAPGRLRPCDVDDDGDMDLLAAELGDLFVSHDREGGSVGFRNNGDGSFTTQTLTTITPRVTDLRPTDLDGDGDTDIVQASANLAEGGLLWLRNEGDWRFTTQSLASLVSVADAPVGDLDGDADIDIAALFALDREEVRVFRNDGAGRFEDVRIYEAANKDFHAGALELTDLDGDGDLDMLLTNGDSRGGVPRPRPWHGVQWLENKGELDFEFHRIGSLPGASQSVAFDFDNDGDLDIFTVAAFANWRNPDSVAFACFENNGDMQFQRRVIPNAPTHLRTVVVADADGDGQEELLTGGLALTPPRESAGRILIWKMAPPTPATCEPAQ